MPMTMSRSGGSTMDSRASPEAARALHRMPDPAMSRREAMSAGLVVAGAVGLAPARLSPASSSSPDSASSAKIGFGGDRRGYDGLHAANRLAVGLRWFLNGEHEIPSAWPIIHRHAHMTLSLRPNPADLLSGRLD